MPLPAILGIVAKGATAIGGKLFKSKGAKIAGSVAGSVALGAAGARLAGPGKRRRRRSGRGITDREYMHIMKARAILGKGSKIPEMMGWKALGGKI